MLLDWLDEAELDRVGCFRYEPVARRRVATISPRRCRTRSRRSAGTASWQHQQAISTKRLKRKVGTPPAGHHRRGRADRRQGPQQGRRAGDRRRGLCDEPAAAAGRRDRHGEDRARRRIRSARHGGGLLSQQSLQPITFDDRAGQSASVHRGAMVKAGVR